MRTLVWTFCLLVSAAHATVGGDDRLELLGYEPVDGKVYYLLHRGGEVAGPPRLRFLALRGETPRQPRSVRSWYAGPPEAVSAAFPKRLSALRARLAGAPPAALAGATLTVTHQDLRVCADARAQPRSSAQARALIARWRAGEPDLDSPVCRLLELDVRWGDFQGSTWAEAWGGAQLLSVRGLPDPRFALAVVRYVGQHFESGYAVERPVLLRRGSAPAPATPAVGPDPRCARLRPAPGPEQPIPGLSPGAWRPALSPDDLAPRGWRSARHRRWTLDGVTYTALMVHGAGWGRVAVARAAPGGGVCVVALARDDFGGNGVQITVFEQVARGPEGVVLFQHARQYRGPAAPETGWTALHLRGANAAWLAVPEAARRPRVHWGERRPRLVAE